MNLQEKIAVMQAAADGKAIEWKVKGGKLWKPLKQNVELTHWNWYAFDFRIATREQTEP